MQNGKSISEAMKEFKMNEKKINEKKINEKKINEDVVSSTAKKVQSKAWAKKMKDKWHDIITTAGDNVGFAPERELGSDKPRVISKKGYKNLKLKFINSLLDDTGMNVAEQAWDKMGVKGQLKMVNNIRSQWNMPSYDSIETT